MTAFRRVLRQDGLVVHSRVQHEQYALVTITTQLFFILYQQDEISVIPYLFCNTSELVPLHIDFQLILPLSSVTNDHFDCCCRDSIHHTHDSTAFCPRSMPLCEHVSSAHLTQPPAVYTRLPIPPSNQSSPSRRISAHTTMSRYDDNTAAGMALSQEESMYLTPAASPTVPELEEKENYHPAESEIKLDDDIIKPSFASNDNETQTLPVSPPGSETNLALQPDILGTTKSSSVANQRSYRTGMETNSTPDMRENSPAAVVLVDDAATTPKIPRGLAKVDLEINRSSNVRSWDITAKEPSSRTPSAMLQPYAKYVGTQQSGHHTYNVEVTILTVNMEQSNLSGFLKISDLTPEHPVLETFFTGEIVGGPNQRYSFRTMDPAWGTNEKVDMLHWMRFPAWRQFSSTAKRDMSFDYPLNGQEWYQQEHIFMRWKERFLAPDHRKSNLSGASFEGFYYICLNQMEGKISGVYFHSNSEKYQQLELSHETRLELGVSGVGGCPLVEMR